MPHQLSHSEYPFAQRKFPITLVCDHIMFQPNIGSIFRVCEAFGVEHIIFIGEGLALTPRKISKTSRSTHLMVPHTVVKSSEDALKLLDGYLLMALEITNSSSPLRALAMPTDKPIALIAGSEVAGISAELLEAAHQAVHIEMFGANSSMNVVQAIAIALYELTGKLS
jgi:tRNA G18 (ribose-2'-O)-methylase SpoU